MVLRAWIAVLLQTTVLAHPSSLTCNYDCMAQYTPGSAFGLMYVSTIGATSGDTCKITTDIPSDGYAPDVSYTVTVTSLVPLAQKLTASSGLFGTSTSSNAGTKETSHSHTWTAPSSLSGSVSFRALCGDSTEMWYATEVSANIGSGPFTTASTSTTESTTAGSSSADLPLGVEIGPSVHLFAEVQGSTADVQVTGTTAGWLGIGFSEGSSVSMTGGTGGGSDAFICSDGSVKRYWITSYAEPSGGVSVSGSSCSVISGKTVMRFQRSLAASATEIEVTPGTTQMVIWAYGSSPTLAYHGANRGGSMVDFSTLEATGVSKDVGPILYLHLIFMAISWGTLLPWGVAIANRTRAVTNAAPGAWFQWHKRLQMVGWLVQLVGFAMAVWHVQENSTHFSGLHQVVGLVVVIFGTLQPFNALLRKTCAHPHPGDPKSTGRLLWEVVHKGVGYLATVLGVLNCWAGVLLLARFGYSSVAIVVAACLSGLGTLSVIIFVILSVINKDNCISKLLVGSKTEKGKDDSSQDSGDPVTAYTA